MDDPVWPRPFLDGVADAAGRHAIRRDRRGRLIALRLDDGRLAWRSEMPLRPLLVTADLALGLALAPPRVVALALDAAPGAAPVWTSAPLPWPGWAAAADDAAAIDLACDAARVGAVLALAWRLRPRHTGGAPPGPGRPRAPVESGSCAVALDDGRMLAAPPLPPRPADAEAAESVDDPAVLAQQRLGALTYRLVAVDDGGRVKTVLRAFDATRGALRWECVLDEGPRGRPTPPRPGA